MNESGKKREDRDNRQNSTREEAKDYIEFRSRRQGPTLSARWGLGTIGVARFSSGVVQAPSHTAQDQAMYVLLVVQHVKSEADCAICW